MREGPQEVQGDAVMNRPMQRRFGWRLMGLGDSNGGDTTISASGLMSGWGYPRLTCLGRGRGHDLTNYDQTISLEDRSYVDCLYDECHGRTEVGK